VHVPKPRTLDRIVRIVGKGHASLQAIANRTTRSVYSKQQEYGHSSSDVVSCTHSFTRLYVARYVLSTHEEGGGWYLRTCEVNSNQSARFIGYYMQQKHLREMGIYYKENAALLRQGVSKFAILGVSLASARDHQSVNSVTSSVTR